MANAQRGNSMAETAIVLSLLLLTLFGMIYAGRFLYTIHAVTNGARLGTRYAIVRGSNCTAADCPATIATIQSYVRSQMPMVESNSITVNTLWSTSPTSACASGGSDAPGNKVCVTVSYPFNWTLPFVPYSIVTITSTSTMVVYN